jgi:hypothetical protein
MKFSFPVTCSCGETFAVHVSGTKFPNDVQCPKCHSAIWLVEPLGNVVGMAILGRASAEHHNGDWTLAIVLGAMAVECDLAYLFMKWNRIELLSTRDLAEGDEDAWEKQWRDEVRTVGARLDTVSALLVREPFDAFLSHNSRFLQPVCMRYPEFKTEKSPKQFFIKELFHRRNKIVHSGEINFQQTDSEMCLTLATTLSQILSAMDAQRRLVLNKSRG